MKTFYVQSMGCKSNQFEGSLIVENLIKNGYENSNDIATSDFYILNSCSVTHKSDNESLYLLRNAKNKNKNIVTVLTGCLAQLEKDALLKNDFVDVVVGNDEKLELFQILNKNCNGCFVNDIMQVKTFHEVQLSDTTKTRASIKIQDGCDNRCSYCVIPFARGRSRSADTSFIVDQVNKFVQHGFKEIVFTGIHIGQWGKDKGTNLLDLLKEIETKTSIPRYRLGSLNPSEITDEMLYFLSKSEKFCPHFHLSLQSANDKTLKSMNRSYYNVKDYMSQIDKINQLFDLPFLGSDIITGFAGETDDDFEITKKNLQKSGLSQIHTFPYSVRMGTVGADMVNQVDDDVKNQRASIIKKISTEKYNNFINKNLDCIFEVLIEKHPDKQSGYLKGMTRNYITVHLDSNDLILTNTLQRVQLKSYTDGKVYGELV